MCRYTGDDNKPLCSLSCSCLCPACCTRPYAHPPLPLSSLSVLPSQPQTAAAQGSETENTVIVSDENRGARREGDAEREGETGRDDGGDGGEVERGTEC